MITINKNQINQFIKEYFYPNRFFENVRMYEIWSKEYQYNNNFYEIFILFSKFGNYISLRDTYLIDEFGYSSEIRNKHYIIEAIKNEFK